MTVTFLEMNARPAALPPPQPKGKIALLQSEKPPAHFYRYLYDTIGEDYYWVDRKKLTPEALEPSHPRSAEPALSFCTRKAIPPAWRNWTCARAAPPISPISG